jgi:hypothetical protein
MSYRSSQTTHRTPQRGYAASTVRVAGAIPVASRVVLQAIDIIANDGDAQDSIGNIAEPRAWHSQGAELVAGVFAA